MAAREIIIIPYGKQKELARMFGVVASMVSMALNDTRRSALSRRIRAKAKEMNPNFLLTNKFI